MPSIKWEYDYKIKYFEYDESYIDSEVITIYVDERFNEEPEERQERAREEADIYAMKNVSSSNIYSGAFFWDVELVDVH